MGTVTKRTRTQINLDRLRADFKKSKLTMRQLGDACQPTVSESGISRTLGAHRASARTVYLMAVAMGKRPARYISQVRES